MVDVKGYYTRWVDDPCASLWFQIFKEGCKLRMRQDWKPNQALSIKLMIKVLEDMDKCIVNVGRYI